DALELRQVVERRLAVARARREDDCPRLHASALASRDRVRLAIAGERGRVARDQNLGAELLGLRERASGELLAGDAGRKPEAVLDSRARPRLPSRGIGLDHE